ncbi:MAG: helix-turn-helix transcriptional regulator, partial [Alphaproteobacteria bacterium]|nr:helix-turn-helix transcriptional regulator [Alphaproteobacteria bacterium]
MNTFIVPATASTPAVFAPPAGSQAAQDYDRVRRALEFLSLNWRDQPGIETMAAHAGLSPSHFTQLFRRWAGITPKQFLQALTLDHARALLRDSASVLDTALEVGLSGP